MRSGPGQDCHVSELIPQEGGKGDVLSPQLNPLPSRRSYYTTNRCLIKPIQRIFTPLSLGDQSWRESIVELASLHVCQILGVVDFIHYLEI